MHDQFVPLDVFLRPSNAQAALPVVPEAPREAFVSPVTYEAIAAARRFRAGLADAIEAAVQALLPRIAEEILGRELRLEPADIAAVIADALARHPEAQAVSLRAHPGDVERLSGVAIPTVPDNALRRGDAILTLHSGTIDLRLESRLQHIISTTP